MSTPGHSDRLRRACRIVVLAPAAGSEAAGLSRTLEDVLRDSARPGLPHPWIDVFAPAGPVDGQTATPSPRVRWHSPQTDLGAVLLGLQPDAHTDIAWLRLGTRVTSRWWQRLQQCLEMDDRLATVSPLVMQDEWLSPLRSEQVKALIPTVSKGQLDGRIDALDRWLSVEADAHPLAIEMPSPDAGLLRGRAAAQATRWLNRQATEGGPSHWITALNALGFSHGLNLRTLVSGSDPPRQQARAHSGLLADRELWRTAHPLTGLRHAVADVWDHLPNDPILPPPVAMAGGASSPSEAVTAAPAPPPVRLHVSHSWGGGLSKWVRDFNRADQQDHTGRGLVLRSVGVFGAFGQRLTLHAADDDGIPLRFWELGVPIHATAVAHPEVRAILREIIDSFGVEQVIVSSVIGHSLDVLRTGLPTVLVAHDHHPFCVALYASFGGECRQCDRERLSRCLAHNPEHRFFPGVTADDWMALRSAFTDAVTESHLAIAAPSRSVAQRWQSMMPDLHPGQFRIIEHGLDLEPAPAFEPPAQGPLRVLVLGRLTPEKGVALLMDMLPTLLDFCELLLVGCGERLDPRLKAALDHPRVRVLPEFDNRRLPQVLAELKPHVGLMMSTVPETFSYTLSELWHCGIPVVATTSGALADRIEHGRSGFVEPVQASALLRRLRELNEDRSVLGPMRQALLARQVRSHAHMVRDYDGLLNRGQTTAAGQALDLPVERGVGGRGTAAHLSALHVNPEATWRQTALAFWQFTCLKASRSPRVPPAIQRWFARRLKA